MFFCYTLGLCSSNPENHPKSGAFLKAEEYLYKANDRVMDLARSLLPPPAKADHRWLHWSCYDNSC